MALDDRERNFEDALARNLQAIRSAKASAGIPGPASVGPPAPISAPQDDCPDAEILAAYHERLLDAEEMILRKEHIASCLRCQEVLAQLEATEEIPLESDREEFAPSRAAAAPHMQQVQAAAPAAAPPLASAAVAKSLTLTEMPRRSAHWRWLVPAGALAASLLLWVAIHDRSTPQTQFELAKNQSQPAPDLSPRTPSLPADATREKSADYNRQTESAAKIAPSAKSDAAGRDENAMRDDARKPKPALPSSVPARRGDLQSSDSVALERRAPNAPRVLPQYPSDNKQLTRNTALESPSSAALGDSDSVANSPAPAPPVPPEAKKEAAGDVSAAPTLEESQAVRGGAFALRQSVQPANLRGTRKPVSVSSPKGDVVWRLLPSGIIQRSNDAGANWIIQKTPVVADLLAGSAPSNDTCWVVGRSGTILLTTDGGNHWSKVSSPTTDDIATVFAVDAQQATITAAKNNSYKTTNAGATWTALPNP
jgi:hypothetical protein